MKIELKLPETKEQSEGERKDYCASIFAIFPRLEKDIKEKMYEELVKTYTEADDFNKVLKGQGIMEGMAILLEHWGLASSEFEANQMDKQETKVDE